MTRAARLTKIAAGHYVSGDYTVTWEHTPGERGFWMITHKSALGRENWITTTPTLAEAREVIAGGVK